ncbi:Uncharacterised protein [Burkholderia pseudomallei]|nr:Uncharacterised protein [Burkholderia pseudomallei]
MRRYRDVLVQPGCSLDHALEAGDYTLAARIYEECEAEFARSYPKYSPFPSRDADQ